MEVDIIATNPSILALNKPAGLIVHSDGRTAEPSVAEWIALHFPDMADIGDPWVSPQGQSIRIAGLVHRLDRSTSGVLLAARSKEAYDYLKSEFKARRVSKVYRAFVYGHLEQDSGRIVAAIERSSVPPKHWYALPCDETHVRAAITEYTVIQRGATPEGEKYSYVELVPKTGRTHQLRVHMASIGHPLVADHLYAPDMKPILGFTRPALHALSISCAMPGGESTVFEAPLPEDFVQALHPQLQ